MSEPYLYPLSSAVWKIHGKEYRTWCKTNGIAFRHITHYYFDGEKVSKAAQNELLDRLQRKHRMMLQQAFTKAINEYGFNCSDIYETHQVLSQIPEDELDKISDNLPEFPLDEELCKTEIFIRFENADDAMLFKLTWGGV